MSVSVSRLRALVVSVMLAALLAVAFVAPASAENPKPSSYNNATVNISGGNANALAACVNYAKLKSKHGGAVQSNFCKNFAKAKGGDVELKNVDLTIFQSGSWTGTTRNNATVNITGGDANALAACVNVLQGGASAFQKNVCSNTAVAVGGSVSLKNVSITIIQEG